MNKAVSEEDLVPDLVGIFLVLPGKDGDVFLDLAVDDIARISPVGTGSMLIFKNGTREYIRRSPIDCAKAIHAYREAVGLYEEEEPENEIPG